MGSIFNFTTDFDRVMNQDVSEINLPPLRESAEKACFIYIIFHGVSHGDETVYRSRLEPCSFFRRAIGLHIRPIAMTSAQTQTDDSLNRRGRAWPGHPRAAAHALRVSVDARHKAGQDDYAETESSECI